MFAYNNSFVNRGKIKSDKYRNCSNIRQHNQQCRSVYGYKIVVTSPSVVHTPMSTPVEIFYCQLQSVLDESLQLLFSFSYRQHCAKRKSAGIQFTQRPILRFFAPQGRHVAPMGVKFGMEEGTWDLLHAKFHPHRCNDKGVGPPKLMGVKFGVLWPSGLRYQIFGPCLLQLLPAAYCAQRKSAGISFTQRPILRFSPRRGDTLHRWG